MNFSSSTSKYHLYHSEGGESHLKWLTRINILFLLGNSSLLALEVMNPFFGYWHAFSEAMLVAMSLVGANALHYYSVRMVNDLWICADGKNIEISFMNAFFLPKTE